MDKTIKSIGLIAIGIILGLLIHLIWLRKSISVSEIITNWRTDTIYVDKPYPIPKPYPIESDPILITIYKEDSTLLDSIQVILHEKDLFIISLQDSIRILASYFINYPSNPKLIQAFLDKDNFSLSLLNLEGKISRYDYPIFLSSYRYTWTLEGLSKEIINKTPTRYHSPFNYYSGGGYDILQKTPFVFVSGEKQWRKLKLEIKTQIGLLGINKSNLTLGMGYKLNNE